MHELTTTTPDFVFWAVTLLLVLRLLASQDPRWWLAIGGCGGLATEGPRHKAFLPAPPIGGCAAIATEAKWNIAFLLAALIAGFLATEARRLLLSGYLLLGAVIAAA